MDKNIFILLNRKKNFTNKIRINLNLTNKKAIFVLKMVFISVEELVKRSWVEIKMDFCII